MGSTRQATVPAWGDRQAIAMSVDIKNLTCRHLLGEIPRSEYRRQLAQLLDSFQTRMSPIATPFAADASAATRPLN